MDDAIVEQVAGRHLLLRLAAPATESATAPASSPASLYGYVAERQTREGGVAKDLRERFKMGDKARVYILVQKHSPVLMAIFSMSLISSRLAFFIPIL